MQVIDDVRKATEHYPHVSLTVGSFDGVHLGHQKIIERVVDDARRHRGTAAVLTMRPHPRQFFSPKHAPNLLTSEKKKEALLEENGIDVLYVLPFNEKTAAIEPEAFVREIVLGHCNARNIVVGHDCRFGKGAKGDFELLRRLGPECGFLTEQVPPLFIGAERVSSTLIRERVLQGDLEEVRKLLGRRYSLVGSVVGGRGIGSKLGFPTANVKPDHSAVPAQGVYIAEAVIGHDRLPAAVNIGIAPTIRHEDLTVEAHILDFHENLVGKEIEIIFHIRMRPEMKFRSYDELTQQIERDVEATRRYFADGSG